MRRRESGELGAWARDAAGLFAVMAAIGAMAVWGQAAAF